MYKGPIVWGELMQLQRAIPMVTGCMYEGPMGTRCVYNQPILWGHDHNACTKVSGSDVCREDQSHVQRTNHMRTRCKYSTKKCAYANKKDQCYGDMMHAPMANYM